ncbi:hypothetical protein LCGC14_2907110, partial [marine sediment metagenome]
MKSMRLSAIAAALMVAMPLYAQTADPAQPKLDNNTQQATADTEQESKKAAQVAEDDIEIIAVTGVYQADLKARAMERDAKAFSSVIATDDMGNFVDQNVAESLRRIPGVTLERSEGEGKYIA